MDFTEVGVSCFYYVSATLDTFRNNLSCVLGFEIVSNFNSVADDLKSNRIIFLPQVGCSMSYMEFMRFFFRNLLSSLQLMDTQPL